MGRWSSFSNYVESVGHTLLRKIQYWESWKLPFSLFSVKPLKEFWPQGWPPYNTFMLVFVNKSVKEQFLFLTDLLSYTKNKIIIILCANSQQLSLLIILELQEGPLVLAHQNFTSYVVRSTLNEKEAFLSPELWNKIL